MICATPVGEAQKAALGLLPPAWDPAADVYQQRGDELTIPSCGIGDLIRNGMIRKDGTGRDFAIEPLMEKHKVDMYLCGHMHNYERLFPVLNGSFTPNVRRSRSRFFFGRLNARPNPPTRLLRAGDVHKAGQAGAHRDGGRGCVQQRPVHGAGRRVGRRAIGGVELQRLPCEPDAHVAPAAVGDERQRD